MTAPLSLPRFEQLADAYGGVIARWPEPYRDAALLMARDPAAARILARASSLDDTLDGWRVAAPSARLRDAVSVPVRDRPVARRARLWWSGIGIAAALAGATAGVTAVAMFAPIDMSSDGATSFGDIGPQES